MNFRRALLLLLLPLIGCAQKESTPPFDANAHRTEIEKWRTDRIERLKAEDSWLTLVGLHWLTPGENRFGSAPSNQIVIASPNVPAEAGAITLADGKLTLQGSAGMTIDGKPVSGPVELRDDSAEEGPTVIAQGPVRYQVIKRGERLGLRVKDAQSPTRTQFTGIDAYPIDPKWRVEAKFVRYDPAKSIQIADVTGMVSPNRSPGALVFTLDGREYRLDPIQEKDGEDLFVIFKDLTNRDATYPAGRYLYAAPPGADGNVILDFNKAYNPPCAFTEFATCPLPPPQNRLALKIEAGEKKFAGGH